MLDLPSRRVKGRKIERLLGPLPTRRPLRLLEIGCGSGGIAAYFAGQGYAVDAVDVADQRVVADGYRFTRVDGTDLPFAGASFDVVISNHVVEHVGDRARQRAHFTEFARVLRADGVGYVAVPNRWAPIEPHFRVPLLSWPPRRLRTPYLRMLRGTHYDCEPLGPWELDGLLAGARLASDAIEDAALDVMLDLDELDGLGAACVRRCPAWLRRALRPAMPTLIRRVRHA